MLEWAAAVTDATLAERLTAVTPQAMPADVTAALGHIEMLQAAGIASVAQLIEAIGHERHASHIRATGCWLLAMLGVREAGPALLRVLEHGADDGVGWEAAKGLIRLQAGPDAAPTLLRVLEHGTSARRSAAAYVLGWLRMPQTIAPLRAAAMNPQLDDHVRGHAIEALGVLAARAAVVDLIALLAAPSPELRYWSAYALGQIGDPAAIPALEQMASQDEGVLPRPYIGSLREEALEALQAIRDRKTFR